MYSISQILLLSLLGPIVGSLIGVWKKPSDAFMYNMLAFAAGVMLSISFLQLIPQSIEISSPTTAIIGISIGTLLMYAMDKLIPHIHPQLNAQEQGRNLERTAMLLTVGIFLHNLPEGMAMAIGAVTDTKTGVIVALAIMAQDIPEGICTSAPYYMATGNRLKAFLISASTAIPTIIGFFIANQIFQSISNDAIGVIIASTAGIMVYICVDELIPTSCGKTESHSVIFSLLTGIVFVILIMAI